MGIVNVGRDMVSRLMGDSSGATGSGANVSYTATTLTDTGASFTASSGGPPENGGLAGHVVVSGAVYGVIVKNTATVLTVDFWHSATAPETQGTTPAAQDRYLIVPGGAAPYWMGISVATRAFNAADSFLTNDGTTISELYFSSGGLRRQLASWSHTNGNATYQVAKTFTANGSDTLPQVIAKVGLFQCGRYATQGAPDTTTTGLMAHMANLAATATLSAVGDNVAITDTITIS